MDKLTSLQDLFVELDVDLFFDECNRIIEDDKEGKLYERSEMRIKIY